MRTMRLVSMVALAAAIACASTEDDAGGPLAPEREIRLPMEVVAPVQEIPLPINTQALAGFEDTIAVEYTDASNAGVGSGFRSSLQLYRRDAELDLVDLGTVYLGVDTLYSRLTDLALTADRAAVTLNWNDGPGGWVAVVATDVAIPVHLGTVAVDRTIDRALAAGPWLLVAAGTELSLVDLESPGLRIVKTFEMDMPATCLLPVSDGFLVFTNAGYGHVVARRAGATWTASDDARLRAFGKAYVSGGLAHAAGPSTIAGYTRLAQLDVSDPAAPSLSSTLDLEGSHREFSYDGAGTYLLTMPASWSDPVRTVVVRDVGGTLRAVSELDLTGAHTLRGDSLHVRGGLLYATTWRWENGPWSGLGIYRLPQ